MRLVEYWNYLDRPETFIGYGLCSAHRNHKLTSSDSIGDSDDGLGRMLSVIRFWFTKDLVGFGASIAISMGRSNNLDRSTSRGNHANPTILHWENSFGYLKPFLPKISSIDWRISATGKSRTMPRLYLERTVKYPPQNISTPKTGRYEYHTLPSKPPTILLFPPGGSIVQ